MGLLILSISSLQIKDIKYYNLIKIIQIIKLLVLLSNIRIYQVKKYRFIQRIMEV